MKKIIYFHGLETPQGGKKVNFLSSKGLVWAPKMNYKSNPNLFKETLKTVKEINPDYIIGSSMGGYFGYLMGTYIPNTKVLLFNPAVYLLDKGNEPIGSETPNGTIFLSENDDVIIPSETIERFKNNEHIQIKILKNGIHRIPTKVFEKEIGEYI